MNLPTTLEEAAPYPILHQVWSKCGKPCHDAIKWLVETNPNSQQEAWDTCPRVDWLPSLLPPLMLLMLLLLLKAPPTSLVSVNGKQTCCELIYP